MRQSICNFCGGIANMLGILGRLIYYRCEDCGHEQSEQIESEASQ